MRRKPLLSALCVCALFLVGCEIDEPIVREDLVGTYRLRDGYVMTLSADGQIVIEWPNGRVDCGAWKFRTDGWLQTWMCGKPDPEHQCTGSSQMAPSRRGGKVVFDTGETDRDMWVKQD